MNVDGLLLDVDGTLLDANDAPIPGAVEAVTELQRRGLGLRYLTNTTRRPRAAVARRLERAGFPVTREMLFTAPVAAAHWLAARGIRRVALFVADETRGDFSGFTEDHEAPEAVVIGDLGSGWDAATLNRAFQPVRRGVPLIALQKNRWWHSTLGPALDAGAYVAALEYAARTTATVLGKPSPEFFLLAAASLGMEPGRLAVVGDDLDTDIAGARTAGMRAVLVRTGRYAGEIDGHRTVEPDRILDSVAALPAALS